MKISATYHQQLTARIHMVMVRKFLILRSAKSISDRLLDVQFYLNGDEVYIRDEIDKTHKPFLIRMDRN
jgi:hypothetical protein